MIISDLNHIETVESNQVVGGCGHKKDRNVAIAVAVAVAGDRKKDDDYKDGYKYY
ncbi:MULTISPECIES: hypothetical protein [Fischerella]|uniref:hypothetical protein n=1 Tax=Fischerella TaxID=1190 RepID=UPI0002D66FDB|nr:MULTISPECIES: hypothetical protein [Fischerella]MBD2434797.1 hypothetical protein [Fischerella sp. FACHB-380]